MRNSSPELNRFAKVQIVQGIKGKQQERSRINEARLQLQPGSKMQAKFRSPDLAILCKPEKIGERQRVSKKAKCG